MTRVHCLSLLLCGASMLMAEELPPAAQAVLGMEPFAEYASAGVPLPPSQSQMLELSESQRREQACAMKQVLFRGMARTRAARWRETEQNLAAMAREAAALEKMPPVFAEILRMQAFGDLTGRQQYALRSAREYMQGGYGVDELQMRLLLDYLDADVKQSEAVLKVLPLHAVFNMIPLLTLSNKRVLADIKLYTEIQLKAAATLVTVQDAPSALKAQKELKYLLLLHDTTLPTRSLLLQGHIKPDTPEMEAASAALLRAAKSLSEQRARLDKAEWYGSMELRALDFLLN